MSLNVIEVLSDGKYRLFEDNLKQILSKGKECDKIAVISVFGCKYSGKSFIQNCVIDYISSEHKVIWPTNRTLEPKNGFHIDLSETGRKLIKMFSEPLIVESNGEKTAVILMDTTNIFENTFLDDNKLTNDIIGLFLTTSSTSMYLKKMQLSDYSIENFEKFAAKSYDLNGFRFQQILFVVRDWFGQTIEYNNGTDYVKQLFPDTQLDNYFQRIDVSIIYQDIICKSNTRIIFNNIRPKVGKGLSETIKKYIINSDQMSFKTYPNSDQPIKVDDLFRLFKTYVNKLNGESIPEFEVINISSDESIEDMDTSNSGDDKTKEIMNETLVDDIGEALMDTSEESNNDKSNDSDNETGKIGIGRGRHHNHEEAVVINQRRNDLQTQRPSYSSVVQNKCGNNSKNETSNDNYEHNCQMKDIPSNEKTKVNNDDEKKSDFIDPIIVIESVVTKFHKDLEEYNDKNFESRNPGDKIILTKSQYKDLCKELDEKLKNLDEDTLRGIKDNVKQKAFKYISEINSQNEVTLSELKLCYSDLIDECIDKYKSEFFLKLGFYDRINTSILKSAHNSLLPIINNIFRTETSILPKNNRKLFNETLSELKSRIENGLNSFKAISDYGNEWEELYLKNHCFESHVLLRKHNDIKLFVLENVGNPKFNDLFDHIILKYFEHIKIINNRLIEEESNLNQQIINDANERIWKFFEHQLKSGSYDHNRVDLMFDRLVSHAINTLNEVLTLEDNDKDEMSRRLNSLKTTDKYNTICSNYFRNKAEMQSVSDTSSRDAVALYAKQMSNIISKSDPIDENMMKQLSDRVRSEAMQTNRIRVEAFRDKYNPEYFEEIMIDFVNKTMNEIERNEKIFMKKCKQIGEELSQTNVFSKEEKVIVKREIEEVTDNCDSLVLSVYFSHKTIFGAISDDNIQNVFHISSPNCIAINDEILVGEEAKDYIKTNKQIKELDIKKLLFVKPRDFKIDNDSYPFNLGSIEGFLKIKYNENWLRIETLIALQILDIKSKAEKQLAKDIMKGVFVVPNHYMYNQREDIEKLSNFIELKSVRVLSELTSAAIGYCHHNKPLNKCHVLFIAINDMTCDAAVVRLEHKSVVYENYCHKELNDCQKPGGIVKGIKNFIMGSPDININNIIGKSIEILLEDLLLKKKFSPKRVLSDIVLLGTSDKMDYIGSIISKFCDIKNVNFDQTGHFVLTGAHIYGKYAIEGNEKFRYDVKEVAFHDLSFTMKCKDTYYTSKQFEIVKHGKQLPFFHATPFAAPSPLFSFPIHISIHQNNTIVRKYQITSVTQNYRYSYIKYDWRHIIQITVEPMGEIEMSSYMSVNDNSLELNDFTKISYSISSKDLESDKQFIDSLRTQKQMIKEENKLREESNQKRELLVAIYQQIREKFQNNCEEMTRLKKKRIDSQLNDIEQTLDSSDIEKLKELDGIEKQLKELDQLIG